MSFAYMMPTGISFLVIDQASGEQPGIMALTESAARNGLQVFRILGSQLPVRPEKSLGPP